MNLNKPNQSITDRIFRLRNRVGFLHLGIGVLWSEIVWNDVKGLESIITKFDLSIKLACL